MAVYDYEMAFLEALDTRIAELTQHGIVDSSKRKDTISGCGDPISDLRYINVAKKHGIANLRDGQKQLVCALLFHALSDAFQKYADNPDVVNWRDEVKEKLMLPRLLKDDSEYQNLLNIQRWSKQKISWNSMGFFERHKEAIGVGLALSAAVAAYALKPDN